MNISNFQINPFVPNAPFLYPLKTSEKLTFIEHVTYEDKYCDFEIYKKNVLYCTVRILKKSRRVQKVIGEK